MAFQTSYPLTPAFSLNHSWIKEIGLVFGASILIALFASIKIPLPFTPVPIGTQAHAALFLAALLGGRRGALAVLLFLFYGMGLNFPVFAGGKVGLAALVGPTGGYLIGYLLAAYAVGFLQERAKPHSAISVFFHLALGNLVIYACGISWLASLVGIKSALLLGFFPFIPGDLFKLFIAAKGLKSLRA